MKKITLLIVILLTTLTFNAQISESFEGTFPPTGWAAFPGTGGNSDSEWLPQDEHDATYGNYGFAHTGDHALISSFDSEDDEGWLVTPQFTPTATDFMLYFHHRQAYDENYDDLFTIKVSDASQTTHADFTIIEAMSEDEIPMAYSLHSIDLSAYIGTPIYVAFIHTTIDGDEWFIDDVMTQTIPLPGATTTPSPVDGATGVVITNQQTSRIDISWGAPTTGGNIDQYNFLVGPAPNELSLIGHPTSFEAHPQTFHFNTTYYWKATAVNMMGETSPVWSFTTIEQPTIEAPYTIDFENGGHIPDGCDQAITNNKWWQYHNAIGGHIGNNGDAEGTATESGGYFAYIKDITKPNGSSHSLNTTFKTPFIYLAALRDPELTFYMISNGEGEGNVDFSVQVGTDSIGWTTVFSSNSDTAGWEKKAIDLSSFDTATPIQAKFIIDENVNTTKDDFAIDDIKFDNSSTASTIDNKIEGLSYFPNPAKDIFTIKTTETIKSIQIFDLLGRLVLNFTPDFTEAIINTTSLASGNYLVEISTNTKKNTIKLVKE